MWKWVTKIFKRPTPEQRLLRQYDDLIKQAHDASQRDRRASDLLRGEAEDIWTQIETLRFNQSFENDNQ
jgi:hypothetical protein